MQCQLCTVRIIGGERMSLQSDGGLDRAILEQIMADSGVKITAEDVDSVARSLASIHKAASVLLQSLSFDTTVERFALLLENDFAAESGV